MRAKRLDIIHIYQIKPLALFVALGAQGYSAALNYAHRLKFNPLRNHN